MCHSDSATVEGALPIQWPRVPGHEAVGRIDLIGEGVEGWVVGQRVGVGFLGGSCGYCLYCRDGDIVNCINQAYTGVQHDGGYAEVMIAEASGLIAVPDALSSIDAAPLLCAGLTTFSALRNAPARAGDLVAVFGVGGLGHLGVQYARAWGSRSSRSTAAAIGPNWRETGRPSPFRQLRLRCRQGASGARGRRCGVGYSLGRQGGRFSPRRLATAAAR